MIIVYLTPEMANKLNKLDVSVTVNNYLKETLSELSEENNHLNEESAGK